MGDVSEFDQAVTKFRRAEEAILELLDQAGSLVKVGQRFEEGLRSLVETGDEVTGLVAKHGELADALAGLSRNLAETTEVVRKIDPARLYSEIEKVRKDFQAQIERIGSLGGDLKTRIESSGKKVSTKVGESESRLLEVLEAARIRNRRFAIVGILIGLSVIGLEVAQLVIG